MLFSAKNMFIRKILIDKYKVLENISINFENITKNGVFPIISLNGGGKSTLLQFIFTFLHCPFRENRFEYIRNFLQDFVIENKDSEPTKIATFELEHENQIIELEFYYVHKNYKNLNFDSILALRELNTKKIENEKLIDRITFLNRLEDDIKKSRISDYLVKMELVRLIDSSQEKNLRNTSNSAGYLSIIQESKKQLELALLSDEELNTMTIKTEIEKEKLLEGLQNENLEYGLHFNQNQNVLLYRSNVKLEILAELSDKVYLATPNTQVLHFLSDSAVKFLFEKNNSIYTSYESAIRECQKSLTGLFTYDFSVISLILEAFQKARDADFAKAIETGSYGNEINKTTLELSSLLDSKMISIDKDFKSVSFKRKDSQVSLSPKDLSHGELKKLSIYIWLKAKTSANSVVLMDEVDMGLHPTWQHELCDNLQEWSSGGQFLLATHSPQIISTTHYKNLVVLTKISETSNNSTSEQFSEAPLDSDLNTIVKTIMGGEYIPKELQKLHKKYRSFVAQKILDSEEAIKIKQQILEYESENSSFFQDIKFEFAFS